MSEKFYIWGDEIPYNTGTRKLDDMPEIHEDWTMKDIFSAKENNIFQNDSELKKMDVLDTMVYLEQMTPGNISMFYDDIPYLEAYVVEGAKYCVLDVPGGAYISVDMENEGADVADYFNKQGISVFVLRYRTYPYKAPVMFADCQRAIKWLIANSEHFGFFKDNISMLGYSAGGNLVGTTYHLYMNENLLPRDYKQDEIDEIEAKISTLGMIYPKLQFSDDYKLLSVTCGLDAFEEKSTRDALIEKYNLCTKINKNQVPTFLANATDDELISSIDILSYATELQRKAIPFEMHNYGRGKHGFGGCKTVNPMLHNDTDGVETWMHLYCIWMKKHSNN